VGHALIKQLHRHSKIPNQIQAKANQTLSNSWKAGKYRPNTCEFLQILQYGANMMGNTFQILEFP
jgi:hypothetical protein